MCVVSLFSQVFTEVRSSLHCVEFPGTSMQEWRPDDAMNGHGQNQRELAKTPNTSTSIWERCQGQL